MASDSQNELLPAHQGKDKRIDKRIAKKIEVLHQNKRDKYILNPNSPLRIGWDCILSLFVIYVCFKLPLSLSFEGSVSGAFWSTVDNIGDIICICDIILNFRTGYVSKGEVVMSSRRITLHYLRTWFLIDIIASIPLEYITDGLLISSSDTKAVRMSKLFKLGRLMRFGRVIKYLRKYYRYHHFGPLLMILLWSLHWLTCLWKALLVESEFDPFVPDEEQMYHGCLRTVTFLFLSVTPYYSCTIDCGYIDAFSTAIIIFGVLFKAFVVAIVSHAFVTRSNERTRFREKVDSILHEIGELGLPHELQYRIKMFYEYLWLNRWRTSGLSLCNDSDLSDILRKDVAMALADRYHLRRCEVFQECSADCLTAIVQRLQSQVFIAGDYVCRKGDIGSEMYLISRGVVHILDRNDPKVVCAVYSDGDYFGELALLTAFPRVASVVAHTCVEANVLFKNDLLAVFDLFPEYANYLRLLAIRRLQHIATGLEANENGGGAEEGRDSAHELKEIHTRLRRVKLDRLQSIRALSEKAGEEVDDDKVLQEAKNIVAEAKRRASLDGPMMPKISQFARTMQVHPDLESDRDLDLSGTPTESETEPHESRVSHKDRLDVAVPKGGLFELAEVTEEEEDDPFASSFASPEQALKKSLSLNSSGVSIAAPKREPSNLPEESPLFQFRERKSFMGGGSPAAPGESLSGESSFKARPRGFRKPTGSTTGPMTRTSSWQKTSFRFDDIQMRQLQKRMGGMEEKLEIVTKLLQEKAQKM